MGLCRILGRVHVAFRFSTERLYKSAARQACGMRDRACRLAPYRNYRVPGRGPFQTAFESSQAARAPGSWSLRLQVFSGGQSPWELELGVPRDAHAGGFKSSWGAQSSWELELPRDSPTLGN